MKRGCPIEQPRLFFRAVAFLLPYAARKAGNFEKDEGTRNARVQDPEPLQLRFLHLLHLTHSLRETPLQQELSVHAGRDLPLPFFAPFHSCTFPRFSSFTRPVMVKMTMTGSAFGLNLLLLHLPEVLFVHSGFRPSASTCTTNILHGKPLFNTLTV